MFSRDYKNGNSQYNTICSIILSYTQKHIMSKINKNSFFIHFLNETGGRYDPAFVTLMIEKLKEWLPESTEDEDSWTYTPDYYNGQGDYKQFLIDNLK